MFLKFWSCGFGHITLMENFIFCGVISTSNNFLDDVLSPRFYSAISIYLVKSEANDNQRSLWIIGKSNKEPQTEIKQMLFKTKCHLWI